MDSLSRALPPGTQVGFTGLDQLASGGSSKGPGVLVETLIGAGRRARRARVRVRLVPRAAAAADRGGLDPDHAARRARADLRSPTSRSSSSSWSRSSASASRSTTRCCSSPAGARSAHTAATTHDAVVAAMATAGRAVVLSGLDRRDRAAGAGRAARAGAAQRRLRRHAHPARLDRRRADAAARAARRHRAARRLAARSATKRSASRGWTAWARGVVRGRWAAAALALAVLIALIIPVFSLKIGETAASALAKNGPAHAPTQQLLDGRRRRSGVLTPIEVLTRTPDASTVTAQLDARSGNRDRRSLDRRRQQPRRDHRA